MNVVLFGATGMIGEGVLRECLQAAEAELAGFDACFFCLGITSAGMSEAE